MLFMKNGKKWVAAGIGLAIIIALLSALHLFTAGKQSPVGDTRRYDYRDTRQLVTMTGRAAALIEKMGEKAFESFRKYPGRWSLDGNSYLYVYDLDGVNLFHGGYPELKGKNLMDFTDLHGKKPAEMIIDQLHNYPDINPHGWIHYLWVPPGAFDTTWKSSCNFAVTMPDGREVFVGSGINDPLQEREFYRIIGDEAAQLLQQKGRSALDKLNAPEGQFTIHDRGVFVIDRKGNAIIDPGLNLDKPRNLFNYRDITGRNPLVELNDQLQHKDKGWVITLHRKRAGSKPIKQGIYGRRVRVDGQDLIVGAICPLPRPAWMR